ncbi:hypothetical protein [Streptomyces lunalinharesii]
MASIILGLIAGALTYLGGGSAPTAALAGLSSAGVSIPMLRGLIG